MKRIRLSTLMLLVVIVALGTALIVDHARAKRRIAELEGTSLSTWRLISEKRAADREIGRLKRRVGELEKVAGSTNGPQSVAGEGVSIRGR